MYKGQLELATARETKLQSLLREWEEAGKQGGHENTMDHHAREEWPGKGEEVIVATAIGEEVNGENNGEQEPEKVNEDAKGSSGDFDLTKYFSHYTVAELREAIACYEKENKEGLSDEDSSSDEEVINQAEKEEKEVINQEEKEEEKEVINQEKEEKEEVINQEEKEGGKRSN